MLISDLCNATSTKFLPNIANGLHSIQKSQSCFEEIVPEHPSAAVWTIWYNFITKYFYDTHWRMVVDFGYWMVVANNLDRL